MRLFLTIGIALSVGLVVTARVNDFVIKHNEMALVAVLVLVAIVANIDQALQKPADSEAAVVQKEAPRRRRGKSDDEHDIILVGLGRIEERLSQLEKRHEALANSAQPTSDKLLLEVKSALAGKQLASPVPGDKLDELSGALSEAMKQITSRDSQIDVLTKNVNLTNIQRNLVRLTQSLEISLMLQKRIAAGQSDPAESMQFIVDDLESALAANGIEHMVILPGTKIIELKAGSFIPVTVIEAPSEELKGTVKEARTRAYFINEENRPRFISPAKVVLYKA